MKRKAIDSPESFKEPKRLKATAKKTQKKKKDSVHQTSQSCARVVPLPLARVPAIEWMQTEEFQRRVMCLLLSVIPQPAYCALVSEFLGLPVEPAMQGRNLIFPINFGEHLVLFEYKKRTSAAVVYQVNRGNDCLFKHRVFHFDAAIDVVYLNAVEQTTRYGVYDKGNVTWPMDLVELPPAPAGQPLTLHVSSTNLLSFDLLHGGLRPPTPAICHTMAV